VVGSAALVSVVAPAIALALVLVGEDWSSALVLTAFGAIVFVIGIASVGIELASKNFVLDLAPDEHRRPVYIGVNDTLIALPTMLLAGGGIAIDRLGFHLVFIACAICSLLAGALERSEIHAPARSSRNRVSRRRQGGWRGDPVHPRLSRL
jgi:hypothetical protein